MSGHRVEANEQVKGQQRHTQSRGSRGTRNQGAAEAHATKGQQRHTQPRGSKGTRNQGAAEAHTTHIEHATHKAGARGVSYLQGAEREARLGLAPPRGPLAHRPTCNLDVCDVPTGGEQQVLQLEVTMHHVPAGSRTTQRQAVKPHAGSHTTCMQPQGRWPYPPTRKQAFLNAPCGPAPCPTSSAHALAV